MVRWLRDHANRGGRVMPVVTVYTIDGRDETTDPAEAEAATRRGHHVTARSRRVGVDA